MLNRQRGANHFLGGDHFRTDVRDQVSGVSPHLGILRGLKAYPLPTETKSWVWAIFDIDVELIPDVAFSSTSDDPAGKGSSTATSNAENRHCHLAGAWLARWPMAHRDP